MTLKDIAAMAGVSVSTVSRVINSADNTFASEEVRNRVWDLVKETGYVPNQSARNLRSKNVDLLKSKTLSCIFGRAKTPADNPFFAQVARAIEQQALQMGYVVSSTYSLFDLGEPAVLQSIAANQVEGAIVLGRFENKTRDFLRKHYKNIVYTGLNSVNDEWDQIICDGYLAAQSAIGYLWENGHRKIGYIGEISQETRYTAYKDFMEEKGIPLDLSVVVNCPLDGVGGYISAKELLEKASHLPSAVFCANDITAIAAIRRFHESGIQVPRDLSIISIDNIDVSQYISPMLTTIDVPKVELGQMATRILVDRINHGHHLPVKILFPHKLIVRESVSTPSHGQIRKHGFSGMKQTI